MIFEGQPELVKENSASRQFICTQCGECCHIREKNKLNPKDESLYVQYMLNNFGIIYLDTLSNITINIMPEEREKLLHIAKERGMKISIKPKRAFYDKKNNSLTVMDYFINHDICPFFDEKNRSCTIYDDRPMICRSYPLLSSSKLGKCRYKKNNPNDYGMEKDYAARLDKIVVIQKSILNRMMHDGFIDNEVLSEEKINNLLKNFKELRIL